MNPRIAVRLASILALSSVRAQRARGSTPTGFAKSPKLNMYLSLGGFPLAVILTYGIVGDIGSLQIGLLYSQFMIFLPSLMAVLSMMYSLMFEFSQSSSAASTDLINWLPIGAEDFVLASSLASLYFISPIVSIILGVSLGLAAHTGFFTLWVFSAVLGLVGCFIGAFILEVARALLNRAASALSGRAGRSALIARTLTSIVLIVVITLLFNTGILLRIVGWFAGSIAGAWFVPIIWPSLAIINSLYGNVAGAVLYTVLSLALTLTFFFAAVTARVRYWVPTPFSVKLGPMRAYAPRRGLIGMLGFTTAETAMIRKDLRSLVRRREMVSMIAIPVMMVLMAVIQSGPNVLWDPAASTGAKTSFIIQIGFGMLFLTFYLALSGIGQEGGMMDALVAAPLGSRQIVRAKIAAAVLPSIPGGLVLLSLVAVFVQPGWEVLLTATAVGFSVLLEVAIVGLAVGARYPDFSEIPRARFISREGALIGMLVEGVCSIATLLPIILMAYIGVIRSGLPVAAVLSIAIATVICYMGYRACLSAVRQLTMEAAV
ncbi:MAG: hypothetical protein JSV18_04250 [Candidatus Bathyarchaeota archaeon]|nr:MAG: hypothetical protein JSV18_04250 [Candidatus Bathyarchaeota archaeon]